MSLTKHLVALEPDELVEVYSHWAGEIGAPSGDEALVKQELARLMTDTECVSQRYKELPPRCRDFMEWMLVQDDFAVPLSRLDNGRRDLPVKAFEVEAVAFALKKRGFLAETRDLSWVRYDEPVLLVPEALAEALAQSLGSGERSLDSQLTLRAFLRTVNKEQVEARLADLDLDSGLVEDRARLLTELARPDAVERALAGLPDPELRSAASRCLYDHGGIIEARHLERLGYSPDLDAWRTALERALLGTVMQSELTDVGLQLGPGSLVVFLDLTRHILLPGVEVQPDKDPEPPADVIADIAAIRTFIDHHSVRVTRDGTLYRATRRKMENELLSPGARPLDQEDTLSWILDFLVYAELVGPDQDGRMRTSRAWDDFDARGPVARTEALLTYVHGDVKDAKGAFHQPRLRKILLQVLRDAGPSRWLSMRHLSILARNRYLMTLDREACGERFQKRYKYAPIPPLAAPGILTRELVRFGSGALASAGLLEVFEADDQPVSVRMTRLGAAVLGISTEEQQDIDDGAMIVTADFEIVLFPDAGGIELIHEVGRFARREKADYSLHYRVSERSVQEAAVGGLGAEAILDVLRTHGRHDVPQNVEASIRDWAADVQVLSARRTLLIQAPSKEALDAALKIKELKAIAGERLNDTVIELSEDPSNPRVAEALRGQSFFLR